MDRASLTVTILTERGGSCGLPGPISASFSRFRNKCLVIISRITPRVGRWLPSVEVTRRRQGAPASRGVLRDVDVQQCLDTTIATAARPQCVEILSPSVPVGHRRSTDGWARSNLISCHPRAERTHAAVSTIRPLIRLARRLKIASWRAGESGRGKGYSTVRVIRLAKVREGLMFSALGVCGKTRLPLG